MKKVLAFILACALMVGLLAGCGSTSGSQSGAEGSDAPAAPVTPATPEEITKDYLIRVGVPTGGKHYNNYLLEQFQALMAENSGGKITVEVYPAGQLGTVSQMAESVLDGSLCGVAMPAAYLATFAPAISVLELPFFFDSEIGVAEQSYQILHEGTSLDEYLAAKGFTVGAWVRSGDNYVLSSKPINSVADMEGKKIRCHTSKIVQDSLSAFGAAPTMVDTSDLASNLQNGTIDATESDPVFAFTQKYYEVTGNYLELPVRPNTCIFALSTEWMSTLPENVQALILETANQAVELEYEYYLKQEATCYEGMRSAGVNIVTPDDTFVSELKSASAHIAQQYVDTDADCARIYDEFVELVANYSK